MDLLVKIGCFATYQFTGSNFVRVFKGTLYNNMYGLIHFTAFPVFLYKIKNSQWPYYGF